MLQDNPGSKEKQASHKSHVIITRQRNVLTTEFQSFVGPESGSFAASHPDVSGPKA